MSPDRCRCCGQAAPAKTLEGDIRECSACGSWSCLSPVPSGLYGDDYFLKGEYVDYEGHRAVHRLNFRRKFKLIEKIMGQRPESVLDLGCAYGFFLDVCRESGVSGLRGVEVNEEAIARCRKAGFDVVSPGTASAAVQLVTFWDVYEHLPDPFGSLQNVSAHQKPGSYLAVSTVDRSSLVARLRGRRWRQFHPPTHLNYPTRAAMAQAFRANGYEVRHHESFGFYRALEQYAPILHRLKGLPPFEWLRKIPIYFNLYDTQLIIGRKIR